MSVSGAVLDPARSGLGHLRERFGSGSPRDAEVAKGARTVAILLAATVVAYHYSLSTLMRTVSLDTPLAYLGLVPVMALGLAALRAQPTTAEPPIHDRQLDYIVAVPLLAASLAVNMFLPARLSAMFWVWRVDLLGLPLFVAGAITLLFGLRMLWRLRVAVAFLFLAWPFPYSFLLMRQLENFTNATVVGVRLVMHVVPVAHQLSSSDGVTFQIEHGARGFPVSVASACSGVNGLVGYALLSAAFLALVKGSAIRKIAWLVVGLIVTWFFNVLRIVSIFAAGKEWGQGVAIDGLHPFLGLVTFSLGVLLMLRLLGPFGLHVPFASPKPGDAAPAAPSARRAVPRTTLAVIILGIVAVVSGVANAGLQTFDLVANVDGTPRLASFLEHPAQPDGWREYHAATYDWTRQFFGSDSNWFRFVYTSTGTTAAAGTTSSVIADVINTSDLSSFSTYGIEACYSFHGYALKSIDRVKLGGVYGNVVSYNNTRTHSDWTNVYWIWPVRMQSGDTRYERVNLLMTDSAAVDFGKAQLASARHEHRSREALVRDFLVGLARKIVHTQAPAPST